MLIETEDRTQRLTVPWVLTRGYEPVAEHLLRRYFGLTEGTDAFTGAWFETVGRRWDDPAGVDRIDATDLVAVRTLSADVPARAAIALLGPDSAEMTALLGRIPASTRLIDVDDAYLLDRAGAPQQLWLKLRSYTGIGATVASKLLARKRPHLFPVHDDVVATEFGLRDVRGWWPGMRRVIRADDDDLYRRAEQLAATCGVGDRITPLRVIDVVTWMHGRDPARSRSFAVQTGRPVPTPRPHRDSGLRLT
jgi:Family of unknown function (DUF6308)